MAHHKVRAAPMVCKTILRVKSSGELVSFGHQAGWLSEASEVNAISGSVLAIVSRAWPISEMPDTLQTYHQGILQERPAQYVELRLYAEYSL